MATREPVGSPSSKRRKLNSDQPNDAETDTLETEQATSKSLSRPISPPPSRRRRSGTPEVSTPRALAQVQAQAQTPLYAPATATSQTTINHENEESTKYIPSPIQLTRIKDLPASHNLDTVGLEDILGDPMIRECWNFNFLFDVEFVMYVPLLQFLPRAILRGSG